MPHVNAISTTAHIASVPERNAGLSACNTTCKAEYSRMQQETILAIATLISLSITHVLAAGCEPVWTVSGWRWCYWPQCLVCSSIGVSGVLGPHCCQPSTCSSTQHASPRVAQEPTRPPSQALLGAGTHLRVCSLELQADAVAATNAFASALHFVLSGELWASGSVLAASRY